MKWTHKNIDIVLNEATGSFLATINGKRTTAPSLDAMRKKINDSITNAFEPFDVILDLSRYSASWGNKKKKFVIGKVVGIEKPKNRYAGDGFRIEYMDGARAQSTTQRTVVRAEHLNAYEAYLDAREAWEDEKRERDKQIDDMRVALMWLYPEDLDAK